MGLTGVINSTSVASFHIFVYFIVKESTPCLMIKRYDNNDHSFQHRIPNSQLTMSTQLFLLLTIKKYHSCDAQFPGGPVDHRQPAENLCV